MAQPDPSLGITADFPEATFRDAITFAMQMGEHPDPERRLVFISKVGEVSYWRNGTPVVPPPQLDRNGDALDPTIETRRPVDEEVTVDYAVEVTEQEAADTGVGIFRPTRLSITLADGEYAKVKDCREATYNGDRFIYAYEPESVGLFGVAFHTLVYTAKDET